MSRQNPETTQWLGQRDKSFGMDLQDGNGADRHDQKVWHSVSVNPKALLCSWLKHVKRFTVDSLKKGIEQKVCLCQVARVSDASDRQKKSVYPTSQCTDIQGPCKYLR